MRILFHKVSDQRHVLEIVREGGRVERVECETRSYLVHDLLHYAVESEAKLSAGFWGSLARGTSLSQMNDRTAGAMDGASAEMRMIEQIVGAMSGAVKGGSAAAIVASFVDNPDGLTWSIPAWFTESFVVSVQERMRRLQGHWRSTVFGGVMELAWPYAS